MIYELSDRLTGGLIFLPEGVYMTKKSLLLAGIATVVFSANANAMDYNQYVSAKLNYAFASHDMKYTKLWDNNKKGSISFSDDVWGGNVAYGIKTGPVRTELELNLKQKAEKNFSSENSKAKLSVENRFAMLNAYYDIDTDTKFTPYVGAGLGWAHLKAKENGAYIKENAKPIKASDSRNTFAWQIGAGVSYALTEQLDVDFGYRYIDEGHVSYTDDRSINKYEARSHELSLGVRYGF